MIHYVVRGLDGVHKRCGSCSEAEIDLQRRDGETLEILDAPFVVPPSPAIEKTYQLNRAESYPSVGDQLDALFHAGVFPPEMAERIAAVKAKYPKS